MTVVSSGWIDLKDNVSLTGEAVFTHLDVRLWRNFSKHQVLLN